MAVAVASGIHGLFRLDGGPVDPADVAALGFPATRHSASSWAEGTDPQAPHAADRHEAHGTLTIIVGEVEEREDLAARLGLPQDISIAALAADALRRFGAETALRMIGEWTLLQWDGQALTLMASAARRDRVFYTVRGARCAVSPALFALAALPWVGDALDEAGLLAMVAVPQLRARVGDRTMIAGVHCLPPGGSVTISAKGIHAQTVDVCEPQPRWKGTFADAMAETEAVLRRIMRPRIARTERPAILLSGGLDSTLLAALLSDLREAGRDPLAITAAAPPGSGLPDETTFADLAARTLRMESIHVSPPPEADTYRPTAAMLRGACGPLLSNRHCQTAAFQEAARSAGASMLVNGTYGEFTVSTYPPDGWLRRTMRALRARRHGAAEMETGRLFHAALSAHRLQHLPPELAALPGSPAQREVAGYAPGVDKALAHPNLFHPGVLRMDFPFRDLRLLRLYAGFPPHFLQHGGLTRAPARHLLAGRVPDSIRLRRSGMPASPDHMARLQRQAPQARARIPAFRAAGIAEWLDLDWLDQALARVALHGPADVGDANRTQITALTAEFLLWWLSGRPET